ncbi:MAG TPA: dihydroxyacetone kinase subunit DhaK, partial [Candidatus Limnocylindrales bacterium]
MKKLINDVANVVPEALTGFGRASGDIVSIDAANLVVLRAGGPVKGKVALVSGGGSGHEPLHGGFVGTGMLDAACAGHVFTSPVPDQMEAATRAVDGGAGVLHIVKNYTGDVLNFQLAAELVAGEVEVATVVTNDDVAVQDSLYTAGRRGVGGTVLVEKIAGAKAEAGASLADVTATAVKVNAGARSMGMALTSCIVPAAGTPTFELGDDEIEIGIGIHGEPGRRREKIAPVKDITRALLDPIVEDLGLGSGENVLAFVNG